MKAVMNKYWHITTKEILPQIQLWMCMHSFFTLFLLSVSQLESIIFPLMMHIWYYSIYSIRINRILSVQDVFGLHLTSDNHNKCLTRWWKYNSSVSLNNLLKQHDNPIQNIIVNKVNLFNTQTFPNVFQSYVTRDHHYYY